MEMGDKEFDIDFSLTNEQILYTIKGISSCLKLSNINILHPPVEHLLD